MRAHKCGAAEHHLHNTCWGQEEVGCKGTAYSLLFRLAGHHLRFNGIQDSLCVMVNCTNCQRGEFGVWGGGRLGERCAQSCCLFRPHCHPSPLGTWKESAHLTGQSKGRQGFPCTEDDDRKKGKSFSLWICQIYSRKKAKSCPNKPTALMPATNPS